MFLYFTSQAEKKDKQIFVNSKKHYIHEKEDTQLLYRINQLLIERNLLHPHQSILIAVSGGQDSVCLLTLLYKLQLKWKWKLAVVHCNHKWSDNSLPQAKHVSRLAVNMQVCHYQAITTQFINTEHLARMWRYEILQRIALLHNYEIIITGHNGSDRIETIIHNMIRGSGFDGLQSLSWKRRLNNNLKIYKQSKKKGLFSYSRCILFTCHYTVMKSYTYKNELLLIRPFLNITRIELQQIIKKWNLPVYLDFSNHNFLIRRNRIRNQLLPYLRKYFNPKVDYVLNSLTEVVHADFLYLETISNCLFLQNRNCVGQNTSYKYFAQLDLQLVRVLPLAIQRRILKRFLEKNIGASINFEHVEQIRNYIIITADFQKIRHLQKQNTQKPTTTQGYIQLPNRIKLFTKNNYIYIVSIP